VASLNRVEIIGRLGRDPELRYTQSGSAVASMTIATDESYQDKDGNKVERTEWHRVSVFGKHAENCANYLKKGSMAYIDGSIATRKYTDQQGVEKYVTEIKAQRVQFLDSKKDGGQPQERQQAPRQQAQRQQSQQYKDPEDWPVGQSDSSMDQVPF
jgi:single-strand DNA-binding protein